MKTSWKLNENKKLHEENTWNFIVIILMYSLNIDDENC